MEFDCTVIGILVWRVFRPQHSSGRCRRALGAASRRHQYMMRVLFSPAPVGGELAARVVGRQRRFTLDSSSQAVIHLKSGSSQFQLHATTNPRANGPHYSRRGPRCLYRGGCLCYNWFLDPVLRLAVHVEDGLTIRSTAEVRRNGRVQSQSHRLYCVLYLYFGSTRGQSQK